MTYLVTELSIDRVDLVDEGANSAAFIELYKRKGTNEKMEFNDIIKKLNPEHAAVVEAEMQKHKDALAEANTRADKATSDLEVITKKYDEATGELEKIEKAKVLTEEEEYEAILKSIPENARESYKKMYEAKKAAEEEIAKAKEAEVHNTAVAKAAELKALPVEQDLLVEIIKRNDTKVVEMLATISKAIGDIVLNEVGQGNGESNATGNAWSMIEKKADALVVEKNITKEQAIASVLEQHPSLYEEYRKGGSN